MLRLDDAGGVKVDKHRVAAPENDVALLHIPVYRAHAVQHPQRPADIRRYLPRLAPVQHAALQQVQQRVALHIFLQHRHMAAGRRLLLDAGQVGTIHRQEAAVHLVAAVEAAEDVALARVPMPHQLHRPPRSALEHLDLIEICLHCSDQRIVHDRPPFFSIR